MELQKRCCSRRYEYTKDSVYLTNEQRDFYEENGYLIIRDLVDPELLDACKQRFIDICNKKVQTKGVSAMKDVYLKKLGLKGEAVISRIQNIYFDDVLSKYITYQPIVDIVQSIIGPNISCCHSIFMNKPPNSEKDSSRHPMHQDLYFFPFRPANSVVASWTAVEYVNEENGCLFVVPKSHKMKLQPHDYPPNVESKSFYGVQDVENYSPVNVIMEKGDTVFFHPCLLHGSGPNASKRYRKSLACHYVDSNCDLVDVIGENVRKEQKELSEKWGYGKNGFKMFWKKKCWLVRGSPGSVNILDNKL
ncbi:hypothetical protein RN001_013547 [Aquatica leii]|uniref:phytanoyl-CoA dioxygenase n=1 Tax=Aquatica leii TaxID=1421715 RepID=A0AAN7SCF7_9COLE|nr:hypothetical protein RN001_013547 [Aquatica leii]